MHLAYPIVLRDFDAVDLPAASSAFYAITDVSFGPFARAVSSESLRIHHLP